MITPATPAHGFNLSHLTFNKWHLGMIKHNSKGCRYLIRSNHFTVLAAKGLFFLFFFSSQRTTDSRLSFGLFLFITEQNKGLWNERGLEEHLTILGSFLKLSQKYKVLYISFLRSWIYRGLQFIQLTQLDFYVLSEARGKAAPLLC